MSVAKRGIAIVREVGSEAKAHEITFLAASIAYYAFVSLLPILLLVLSAVTFIAGEEIARQFVTAASDVLTPAGQEIVVNAIIGRAGRVQAATILSVLILLWSSLRVFRGLDEAYSRVYGVGGEESFAEKTRDGLTVLFAIGLAVSVLIGVGIALSFFPRIPFAGTLATIALIAALFPVFLPLYYFLPDVDVTLREIVPGTVVATLGWTVLEIGYSVYVQNFASFDAYGVLGAALLLVTWFYFGAILLLLGVVVNVVLAGRTDKPERKGYLQDRRERRERIRRANMTDSDTTDEDEVGRPAPDVVDLQAEIDALQADLDAFADEVEARTVEREQVERDLESYVRSRIRRGHARGWGPYLVLAYGTIMTLGAFFWLGGGWSILAMLVIWTSTLGVYVLMVLFGAGLGLLGVPSRVGRRLKSWRS